VGIHYTVCKNDKKELLASNATFPLPLVFHIYFSYLLVLRLADSRCLSQCRMLVARLVRFPSVLREFILTWQKHSEPALLLFAGNITNATTALRALATINSGLPPDEALSFRAILENLVLYTPPNNWMESLTHSLRVILCLNRATIMTAQQAFGFLLDLKPDEFRHQLAIFGLLTNFSVSDWSTAGEASVASQPVLEPIEVPDMDSFVSSLTA